jgi:feruloyl esterase
VQCPPGTSDGKCLAPEQVDAARKMYSGPHDPRTGALIFPGTVRGAEADTQFGWSGNSGSAETPFGSIFKWVFGSTFVYSDFDFDGSMATMDSTLASNVNANSVDLSAFRNRGGKFIMYQGWADPLVPPQDAINYYERLVAAQGNGASAARKAQSFYRLFMVPGMYHCAFGPGPNAFGNRFSGKVYAAPPGGADASNDIFLALQDWVEKGVAPTRVTATKYVQDVQAAGVQMTRPICAYPNVARYSGVGDTNKAESFACAPAPGATDPGQVPAAQYVN